MLLAGLKKGAVGMMSRWMPLSLAAAIAGCATPQQTSTFQPTVRLGAPASPISSSVLVPPGYGLVYVSGTVPDVVDPAAPEASPARYGDTETQTRSVLRKIGNELATHRLGLNNVVMMRVFLVAPPGQSRMDFAGMMRAYREAFGTASNPSKPARSTMQVAGLVDPGWLVEIEVTAAFDRRERAEIIPTGDRR
jgi:enamine deaminase RidA (YjgF/YER057c/UK114 family)